MQIYCDLDGTLADLNKHYHDTFGEPASYGQEWDIEWNKIQNSQDFFFHIPPMPDMQELWNFIEPYGPIVLTGVPKSVKIAEDNKRAWCKKYLGAHVKVYCCLSRNKFKVCTPGDILIDDWTRYKNLWEEAGGIWITHISARQTILELKSLGI